MVKNKRHYTLGLYEKSMPYELSWIDKLNLVKQYGYGYLEISIDETDERLNRLNNPHELEAIQTAVRTTGVKIQSLCLSGHRKYPLGSMHQDTRLRGIEIFKQAVDFAYALGIRVIQLAGYDVYYENGNHETQEYFETNLKRCINYASQYGILCGFETMETMFMDTIQKARAWCDRISSPYLGIYPDVGNITNSNMKYGTSIAKDIAYGKGSIIAVHLKDSLPSIYRNLNLGEGHVDFKRAIRLFWNLGVRMYTCEFWYQDDNYLDCIQQNANFAHAVFKELESEGIL